MNQTWVLLLYCEINANIELVFYILCCSDLIFQLMLQVFIAVTLLFSYTKVGGGFQWILRVMGEIKH